MSNSRENLPKNRGFTGAKCPSAVLRCTFSCLRCTISCSWCTIWCSIWAVGAPANDLQVNLLSPAGALSALFFLCHYIGTESSWFLKRIRIMRILSFGSSYMETNWNNWNNYFTNWNNIILIRGKNYSHHSHSFLNNLVSAVVY